MSPSARRKVTSSNNFISIKSISVLMVVILLFFIGIKINREIKTSIWDKKSRLNIVINSDPVIFFSLDPERKKITVIKFSTNDYEEVSGGYGNSKINSLWKLGVIEKKDGKILANSVQSALGSPVDGWIGKSSSWRIKKISEDLISTKIKEISNFGFLYKIIKETKLNKNIKTNLTTVDLIKIWLTIKEIRSDKIFYIDLGEKKLTTKMTLPDGTKVETIDKNKVDADLNIYLKDNKIEEEGFSLEVKNGTKIPGLGSKLSRILSSLGSQIIKVENSPESDKTICLSGEKLMNSYTLKRIINLTNCLVEKSNTKEAEIIIILGKDTTF